MKPSSPLKNLLVLDLSRLIPGPFCSKILSDLGARVIKIEDQLKPDTINSWPPYLYDAESVLGVSLNKNKERLQLDLASQEGCKIVMQLVKKADVFIESYRPGVAKKLGLDTTTLHRINPKLIYVALTGYGQHSSHASQAGHDINFMAVSGLLNSFLPNTQKTKSRSLDIPSFQIADFVGGGLFAAMQILAHLLNHKRHKIYLDIGMVPALVFLSQHFFLNQDTLDLSMLTGTLARYRVYRTRDNHWVTLGALEDKFWLRFCDVIQQTDLKKVGFDRKKNHKAIKILEPIFGAQDKKFWKSFGQKHDVCLTTVSDKKDLQSLGYLADFNLITPKKEFVLQTATQMKTRKKQIYKNL